VLLREVLQQSDAYLLAHDDELLAAEQAQQYVALVVRRVAVNPSLTYWPPRISTAASLL